jgi:TPP-dependent 2-oxoacid decarboxylase
MAETSKPQMRTLTMREYNNVANWKYGQLLEVFGATNPRTFRVETKDELSKLLGDKEFSAAKDIQVCPWNPLLTESWSN